MNLQTYRHTGHQHRNNVAVRTPTRTGDNVFLETNNRRLRHFHARRLRVTVTPTIRRHLRWRHGVTNVKGRAYIPKGTTRQVGNFFVIRLAPRDKNTSVQRVSRTVTNVTIRFHNNGLLQFGTFRRQIGCHVYRTRQTVGQLFGVTIGQLANSQLSSGSGRRVVSVAMGVLTTKLVLRQHTLSRLRHLTFVLKVWHTHSHFVQVL